MNLSFDFILGCSLALVFTLIYLIFIPKLFLYINFNKKQSKVKTRAKIINVFARATTTVADCYTTKLKDPKLSGDDKSLLLLSTMFSSFGQLASDMNKIENENI
jgi:hypothetical protein